MSATVVSCVQATSGGEDSHGSRYVVKELKEVPHYDTLIPVVWSTGKEASVNQKIKALLLTAFLQSFHNSNDIFFNRAISQTKMGSKGCVIWVNVCVFVCILFSVLWHVADFYVFNTLRQSCLAVCNVELSFFSLSRGRQLTNRGRQLTNRGSQAHQHSL